MDPNHKYCILIRDPQDEYGEKEAMRELGVYFVESRLYAAGYDVVVGRYSVLPFYKELENDLLLSETFLINSFSQFRYISDLGNWYRDLKNITPFTWSNMQEYIASDYEGPVVLKGETNSRRDKWLTHMFANNKTEAREVYGKLMDDSLICHQNIYIRKYEPLKKLIDSVTGMPVPNEWRFFICYGQIIASGYYWSTYIDDIVEKKITIENPPISIIENVIELVGSNSNFYSIDIAQKENGDWTVIELNEGQMSGLNGIDRGYFYAQLKNVLENKS